MAGGLCPCLDEFDLVELNPLEIEFDDGTIVRHFRDSEIARLEIQRPGGQSSEVVVKITKEDAAAANASLRTRETRPRFAMSDSQGESPRLHPYLDPNYFGKIVAEQARKNKSKSSDPYEELHHHQLVVSYIRTERIPLGYGRSVGRRPGTQLHSIPDLLHDYSSQLMNRVLREQIRASSAREGRSESPLNAVINFLKDSTKGGPDVSLTQDLTAEELAEAIRLVASQRSGLIDKFKKYGLNVVGPSDRGESIDGIDLDKMSPPPAHLNPRTFPL